MMEFDARAVEFLRDDDLGAQVLVLAEHEDGSGRRLELQRALVITDSDRRLGMATYCLVNEVGATYYGGVEASSITGGVLELRLSDDAASIMDVNEGYRIRLADVQRAGDVVRKGLQAILQ